MRTQTNMDILSASKLGRLALLLSLGLLSSCVGFVSEGELTEQESNIEETLGADSGFGNIDPKAEDENSYIVEADLGSAPDSGTSTTATDAQATSKATYAVTELHASSGQIYVNNSVVVGIRIKATGDKPLYNGQVWIDAKYPSGRVDTLKTAGVVVPLGSSVDVNQSRGPLPEIGTWTFTASLRNADGKVLAYGPSQGLQVGVVEPPPPPKPSMDEILRGARGYPWCGTCQDAGCMLRVGCGSCWAMSDHLCNQFAASQIQSRVLQYGTKYASNHRSVQYWDGGNWVDVPYRAYGFDNLFNATSSKPGAFVQRSCY